MTFTYGQTKALSIIPHVTGALSAIGSAWILYDITSDRQKWSKPYHRLLFSMAAFDVLSSIALGLSTWPIPAGSTDVYDPRGTQQTCSAQAFFVQSNIASPLYNFSLSVYYLCLVRYGIPERSIRQRIEPWMQGLTATFALCTSFICLGLGMFNDSSLWCWINALPKGCSQSYNSSDPDCVRGDNAEILRWAFFFAPLWAAIVGTMVTMYMLWRSVRVQEDKTRKWTSDYLTASQFGGGVPHQDVDNGPRSSIESVKKSISAVFQNVKRDGGDAAATNTNNTNNNSTPDGTIETPSAVPASTLGEMRLQRDKSIKKHRKSNMVMWQAFRYVAAFWLTWLPATLNRLLQLSGRNVFWIFVLHSIFVPLQGAMNWCVYKYPQFYRWKEARRKARKHRREQEAGLSGAESTTIGYTKRFSGMSMDSSAAGGLTRRRNERLSHVSEDDNYSIDSDVDEVISSEDMQSAKREEAPVVVESDVREEKSPDEE